MSEKNVILLVEDDPLMVRMYQRKFEADGYAVILGSDGEKALEAMRTGPKPNIILLDVMMPRMDGFQFLEVVKRNPEYADIPVILLTNISGERGHIEKGMALGATAYLVKSRYTPKQVVEKVEAILRAAA